MRVGLFTDTYFPGFRSSDQYSDAQNRIKKRIGSPMVFIFTTTDKDVSRYEDWQIIRIPSVPFFAFKDRRVASLVLKGACHSPTIPTGYYPSRLSFTGPFREWIGRELRIPVTFHTYHTQYEDYVAILPVWSFAQESMVKYIVRSYMNDLDGVIVLIEIVYDL